MSIKSVTFYVIYVLLVIAGIILIFNGFYREYVNFAGMVVVGVMFSLTGIIGFFLETYKKK